jgi:predicted RNA-binding protein YlqC (UPF0109 family)
MVQELLKHLVGQLVARPQAVTVEKVDNGEKTVVQVRVAAGDLARVIGSEGRTFRALRTLARVAAGDVALDVVVDVAA